MQRPILILQMQRMGDLILSFPLFFWLSRTYPEHPLWVVAEPTFFKGLMPLSPNVVFFPASVLHRLPEHQFELVINLSHRPEAAALAPKIKTEAWIGRRSTTSGETFIEGPWQLYRSSLTLNNRHNLFHWADLNALDVVPHALMASTQWQLPQTTRAANQNTRIGLFLGASEPEKRPSPQFWADLAKELLNKGLRPVFLGGPDDTLIGSQAAHRAGVPALNLTGHFTIPELVTFIGELAFLITPDTGPMHLAAWMGTPTLNLSMGPVNPWETGPYQPGHHIIQAAISCAGCWRCTQPQCLCKHKFTARTLALLVRKMIKNAANSTAAPGYPAAAPGYPAAAPGVHPVLTGLPATPPGLRIACSTRDNGLYYLNFQGKNTPRLALGHFWRNFFALHLGYKGTPGLGTETSLRVASRELFRIAPALAPAMNKALGKLTKEFHNHVIRNNTPLPAQSWNNYPPSLRPITGYIHPFLQNENYSTPARITILKLLELLAAVL